MIDSLGSEQQKAMPVIFPPFISFNSKGSWLALRLICFSGWMVKKKKKNKREVWGGEPCELSRSIASNLQACPTRPQGPPAAHCHDGQLQQLINYAEAINALGKHSTDALLLHFCLALLLSPAAFSPPHIFLKRHAEDLQPPRPVRADGINVDNDS